MGGKKITVASSISNLGGDLIDRPNVLRQTIGAGVATPSKTLGEVVATSYLYGAGIRLRNFYKWAAKPNSFNSIVGGTSSSFSTSEPINLATITPFLPVPDAYSVCTPARAEFTSDIAFEAATMWLKANHPTGLTQDWTCEYREDIEQFEIRFSMGTIYYFTYPGYLPSKEYLVTKYTVVTTDFPIFTALGENIFLSGSEYPEVPEGFVLQQEIITSHTVELNRRRYTTIVASTSETFEDVYRVYHKRTLVGQTGAKEKQWLLQVLVHDTSWSVTQTVTNVTEQVCYTDATGTHCYNTSIPYTQDVLNLARFTKLDSYTLKTSMDDEFNYFIYERNTGVPELNGLFTSGVPVTSGAYYPYIPLRIDNQSIEQNAIAYPWCKRAYKRSFGENKFNNLLDRLDENPDLSKMDYVYLVLGCSLNTKDKTSLEYLYRLFSAYNITSGGSDLLNAYQVWQTAYTAWAASAGNPSNAGGFWTSQQINLNITSPPNSLDLANKITIGSAGNPVMNYNIEITWSAIEERVFGGLGKAGSRSGDIWVATTPLGGIIQAGFSIFWQFTPSAYKVITVSGLVHRNNVYGNKAVVITMQEAMDDDAESGFILPLNYAVFRSMSLVDQTQLSVSCRYMVVNAYEIRKKKWWETWWGVLIVAVVVVGIGVATGMIGATTGGLLGTSHAVGVAIGLTGTAGIFLGALANVVVAGLLMQGLVVPTLSRLLGERWTAILLPVLMLLAPVSLGGSGFSIGSIFQPENILKLTNASVTAFTTFTEFKTQDVQAATQKMMNESNKDLAQLQEKYKSEFGNNKSAMYALTNRILAETSEEFFARTQLTGSDIVALSKSFLDADVMRQVNTTV